MIRQPDIPKTTFLQKTVICGVILFCAFAYKSGIQAQISTQQQQLSENGIRIQIRNGNHSNWHSERQKKKTG